MLKPILVKYYFCGLWFSPGVHTGFLERMLVLFLYKGRLIKILDTNVNIGS